MADYGQAWDGQDHTAKPGTDAWDGQSVTASRQPSLAVGTRAYAEQAIKTGLATSSRHNANATRAYGRAMPATKARDESGP